MYMYLQKYVQLYSQRHEIPLCVCLCVLELQAEDYFTSTKGINKSPFEPNSHQINLNQEHVSSLLSTFCIFFLKYGTVLTTSRL